MAFDIPVVYHGQPHVPPYERTIAVQRFWGVIGAQVLRSRIQVREITWDVTLTDHQTLTAFYAQIVEMDRIVDEEDTGSLFVDGIEWPNCTFLGYMPNEPAFWDASGEHGWTQFGQVKFLQAKEELVT